MPRKKSKGKPRSKKAPDHICRHCGKHLKTEKGLSGHEKRCSERDIEEMPVSLAPETEKMLDITGGTMGKPGGPEDKKVKEEMEHELTRLKAQYNHQKEQEKILSEERENLARERDDLYKGMAASKAKAAAAVMDPFGDGLDDGGELPAISGPISIGGPGKPSSSIKPEPVPPKMAPKVAEKPAEKPAKITRVDLAARTAELKRKMRSGKDEPTGITAVDEVAGSDDIMVPPQPQIPPAQMPGTEVYDNIRNQVETALADRIERLESTLTDITDKVIEKAVIESMMKNRITKDELDDIMDDLRKDLQKIDARLLELGEEVGFGESLNVTKIPPSILESVYEATLADAVKALVQNIGPYDAETVILKVLEDIRTQTSGSELFKYEGGKLRIINLAKSLETKFISAKQIQSTYSEVLKRIKEHVPGFKPKNFRAILKIKSQEFAVDKASGLTDILTVIRTELDEFKGIRLDLENRVAELEEARYALMSDVRELEQKLNEPPAAQRAAPAAEPANDVEEGGDNAENGDENQGDETENIEPEENSDL